MNRAQVCHGLPRPTSAAHPPLAPERTPSASGRRLSGMPHPFRRLQVAFFAASLLSAAIPLLAQDAPRRGRKYKAPPDTSHIEVLVTRDSNGKPISNAAVIFRATRDGKDDGNLEVKTDPDGKATIDVIQTGSKVQVQVFASGYATFADSYQVDEASRAIHVALERPREQVSAYVDNSGKASSRKAGVQEPERAKPSPSATTLQSRPGPGGSAPAPTYPATSTTPPSSTTTPPASSSTPPSSTPPPQP